MRKNLVTIFFLCFGFYNIRVSGAATEAPSSSCPRVSTIDYFFSPYDYSCAAVFDRLEYSRGVFEGEESWLHCIVSGIKEGYLAVLFHASSCPFSKVLRPNFKVMSYLFPAIGHLAIEDSVIKPSTLSLFGVYGFPTLLILNATRRVQYHGSRNISSLVSFYGDVTGIKPATLHPKYIEYLSSSMPTNPVKLKDSKDQQNWPFSWLRSPIKLLQQYNYLLLASLFVLMKLLYFLIPKIKSSSTTALRWNLQCATTISLQGNFQAFLTRPKQSLMYKFYPRKPGNIHEGAMNAKAWAS